MGGNCLRATDGSAVMCEVCEDEPAVDVVAIPGIALSAAYGRQCLGANAHPWHILVAATAEMGGLAGAESWWLDMVDDTVSHLGRTRDDFITEVVHMWFDIAETERKLIEQHGAAELLDVPINAGVATLTCNGCERSVKIPVTGAGMTTEEFTVAALEDARRHGWVRVGVMDYCPKCALKQGSN